MNVREIDRFGNNVLTNRKQPNPKYGTKPRINDPSRGERRAQKRLSIAMSGYAIGSALPNGTNYNKPGSLKCK